MGKSKSIFLKYFPNLYLFPFGLFWLFFDSGIVICLLSFLLYLIFDFSGSLTLLIMGLICFFLSIIILVVYNIFRLWEGLD